jgi:hypothetical protein
LPHFDVIGFAAVLIGGYPIFREAFADLLSRRMTMELSMTIALVSALAIREVFTALVIVFFVLIAEVLEELTVGRGRRAIQDLLNLQGSFTSLRVSAGIQGMQWLKNRAHFWRRSLSLWWIAVLAIWTVFSNAATIRDNFLSSDLQTKLSTSALLPNWGWQGWLIGLLIIGLIATLEGSYRVHVVEQAGRITAEEKHPVKEGPQLFLHTAAARIVGHSSAPATIILLEIEITNRGKPSSAVHWAVRYNSPSRNVNTRPSQPKNHDPFVLNQSPGPNLIIHENELITVKSARPISQGPVISGYLVFLLQPGIETKEFLRSTITVSCEDYLGQVSTVITNPGIPKPISQ